MFIPSFLILGLVHNPMTGVCSVAEMREGAEYVYRVERIRDFVDSATVIVRARAEASVPIGPPSPLGATEPKVRFRVLERIRAPDSLQVIELRASLVDHDDFNRGKAPFTIVRPAGQRGTATLANTVLAPNMSSF
jgi:hypothetical protein